MGVQEERRGKENKIEGKGQWIEGGGRREKMKGKRSRDSEKGEVDRGNEEENGINSRGWRESMRVWKWPFWPHALVAAWFVPVEAIFRLRNTSDSMIKYSKY